MTYDQTRDNEQLLKLDDAITNFITRYNANPSSTNRKTIVLFPGGMGSRLLRANVTAPNGPPYFYDTTWLDCSILFGAGAHLRMQGDVDYDQHIIIPNGHVDFMTLRPYEGFIQWCDANGIDYFIFGWDWRRDLKCTVKFFLNTFLPLFRLRVQAGCGSDPLLDFSLVGHSMGGMIVKLILNNNSDPYVQLIKKAVTVATPFYGYGAELPRYFVGDPDLNPLYGAKVVTKVISSLAAEYTLLFLDEDTYTRDRAALGADPDYPLSSYPILDATAGTVADPYNPKTKAGKVRYPQNYGFDIVLLNRGKLVYQQVAQQLNPAMNNKFFNFRGVQVKNGAVVDGTVNNQTWDWIAPGFDPDTDPSPITDYLGPGDGTLPAWSTRLVNTPGANVRTLEGDVDHMFMMSDALVLNELVTVI
jgi:pimeloyl-ACP methyl ester carboxylesterase